MAAARWFGEEADPRDLMRSLPALRHGKNVMKIHFLWILFSLYACDLAQSQTCMIRVLQVQGDKTVDSPLLLDGSKDVLVSIGRGTTIQGTTIKPVSDPVTGRYAQDTAKELSVAFGSDEATARTRPMSHGDLWFLTARFIGLKIADAPQDALVQFCVFGVAPF